jgi:hypothetical protein
MTRNTTFPKLHFGPPPRTVDLIPAADLKQQQRRRGIQTGLLVRLRKQAHHSPLPSILLANVQSLDHKIDKIQARVAFQRDIRDCNILCFTETWLSWDMLSESVQPPGFSMHRPTEINTSLGRGRAGVYAL